MMIKLCSTSSQGAGVGMVAVELGRLAREGGGRGGEGGAGGLADKDQEEISF